MGETVSTLLFQPPIPSKLKKHKVVWLKTSQNKTIPGFYISYHAGQCKSLSAHEIADSSPEVGITLLYSHANAEDLGSIYPWCKFLSKMLHVNLFAYDYAGYGMATDAGPPSEDNCYADINAAYEYLRHDLDIPAQNIVLYGRSLGSGPSCNLAAKTSLLAEAAAESDASTSSTSNHQQTSSSSPQHETAEVETPVGGLILHAPFLSVFRVVIDTGCTLPGDKFPNLDVIGYVGSPVLLIHGSADQIVPFKHSEKLYETIPVKYRARPLYIDGMSHNNVHSQVRPMFVDRLNEYLDIHVRPNSCETKKSHKIPPLQ